jgi:hypothetical protein
MEGTPANASQKMRFLKNSNSQSSLSELEQISQGLSQQPV